MSSVAALPLPMCVATSSSSVSARSSGVSPGSTMMVDVVVEVVAGNGGHPDHRGVAGAALHGLLDEHVCPPRGLLLHLLGDPLGAVPDDDDRSRQIDFARAWMTCITIGRPQIRCSGLGRADRIREPSPAASTIAETVMRPSMLVACRVVGAVRFSVPGRGFEPL